MTQTPLLFESPSKSIHSIRLQIPYRTTNKGPKDLFDWETGKSMFRRGRGVKQKLRRLVIPDKRQEGWLEAGGQDKHGIGFLWGKKEIEGMSGTE